MTAKQVSTLRFVALRLECGQCPSIREIAAWAGVSPVTAREHLVALRERGYLSWKPHHGRSLRITAEGHRLLGSCWASDRAAAAVRLEGQIWADMLAATVAEIGNPSAAECSSGCCSRTAEALDRLARRAAALANSPWPEGCSRASELN